MGKKTHRHRGSRTYNSWKAMKTRCGNPNHQNWSRYGGRGITVCKRWNKFENFLSDMGERLEGRTLDRKNSDGNYYPSNCRWATFKEQSNNKSDNRVFTYKGEKKTMAEFAEEYNIPYDTLHGRLNRGWPLEKSLTQSVKARERLMTYHGKTQSIKSWADEYKINYDTLHNRVEAGWTPEKALTQPVRNNRKPN